MDADSLHPCAMPAASPVAVICPGPTMMVREDPAGDRWCFGCRARLPHTWVLLDDPPDRQPSWYEPVWVCRCSGCGGARTRFPGYG